MVTNSTIISFQDTLLWDGTIYANNDLIEGNVDYIWGSGVVYFDSCEIRTISRSGGVIVQSRNAAGAYGYVFDDCKLTSDSALDRHRAGAHRRSAYPGSNVAYVNCQMTSNIAAVGWTLTGGDRHLVAPVLGVQERHHLGSRRRRQQAAGRLDADLRLRGDDVDARRRTSSAAGRRPGAETRGAPLSAAGRARCRC